MTVKEIVEEYLDENGYDGLYSDDSCFGEDACGCRSDDLFPCDDMENWGNPARCKPGYKKLIDGDWIIGPGEDDEETPAEKIQRETEEDAEQIDWR